MYLPMQEGIGDTFEGDLEDSWEYRLNSSGVASKEAFIGLQDHYFLVKNVLVPKI